MAVTRAVTSIRPNDVISDIDSINRLIANQDAAMDEVGKQVQFLSSVWDSEAQREFDAAFVQTRREIAEFNRALSQYADMMKMSVKNFEAVDKSLCTSLKNAG
ncbi:MAG: WXG100 family type VII secretion target [Synergistaceae bacterium]|jgi:WXG100 family type VII secretion target|nr:WXG100 family type VII secretion target [Synergistaceae bacterium]